MSIGTYIVLAIIAVLFVLACRHIFHVTLGGGDCCGGAENARPARQEK